MPRKTKKQLQIDEQFYQLTTLVAGDFSLQEVLDKLAEAAVKITGTKACSIRLLDEETGELTMRNTFGLSQWYQHKGPVSRNDPVIRAAFEGEAVILDDMRVDDRVRYKEEAKKEGLVSQLTIGMFFKGQPIGVLRLYRPMLKGFNDEDIAHARAVASQCAVAITNAKLYAQALQGARMAEQLRLAGVIQRRMIPQKPPLMPGLDIAAAYKPCFDVGGDFYDFLTVGRTGLAVVIADVIGKGMPAAIMMSMFRGTLRGYSHGGVKSHTIHELINGLNAAAIEQCSTGEFITLFYAMVEPENMSVTYCNCGHEPGLLLRDGSVSELREGGFVLGILPDAEYQIGTVELKDGDCLLFYTDGLIDAPDFGGQLWGIERLYEAAQKFVQGSARQMIDGILGYRRRFVGLAEAIDDTSIVVVKVDRRAQPKFMNEVSG
jgi:sigma-B regulation protein RsbU (phosphoserine phosphatase)